MNSSLEKVQPAAIEQLLKSTKYANFEYILEDIGIGNRAAFVTAKQLLPDNVTSTSTEPQTAKLVINGAEGLMFSFAKCCHPLPGDPIIGHMSAGRGVVVHVNNCQNAQNVRKNRAKTLELSWADDVRGEFCVPISVEVRQSRGIVASLATKINSLDANIESINVIDQDAHSSRVDIEITVHDRVHLARIMRHIRNIKAVNSISRVKEVPSKRNLH